MSVRAYPAPGAVQWIVVNKADTVLVVLTPYVTQLRGEKDTGQSVMNVKESPGRTLRDSGFGLWVWPRLCMTWNITHSM